jgi:hypothetical protein
MNAFPKENTALFFHSTQNWNLSISGGMRSDADSKKLWFRFHSQSQEDRNLSLTCDVPWKSLLCHVTSDSAFKHGQLNEFLLQMLQIDNQAQFPLV